MFASVLQRTMQPSQQILPRVLHPGRRAVSVAGRSRHPCLIRRNGSFARLLLHRMPSLNRTACQFFGVSRFLCVWLRAGRQRAQLYHA
jgi:hypothetical protein